MPLTLTRTSENLYRDEATKIYYAYFRCKGKQIKRSLKTSDFTLAKRKLKELKSEYADLHSVGKSRTFAELADLWLQDRLTQPIKLKTVTTYQDLINRLNRPLGELEVKELSEAVMAEWRQARAGISPRARNAELQLLKRILEFGKRVYGIVVESKLDIRFEKQTKKALRMPTRAQVSEMLAEMRRETQAREAADLAEFLALSGCRISEAAEVRWEEVFFDKGEFVVSGGEYGTKNHQSRTVPLFKPLRTFLESIYKRGATGKVFKVMTCRQSMTNALKRAKMPYFSQHDLRHYFVSNCLEDGVDWKSISEWVGHSDGGVLVAKTYGHLRKEQSRKMAELVT